MEGIEEQRVCVKFCFKLGKSSSETFELLQQAFGDNVLSRTTCFEWFKRFKEGRTSVKDNERPGRPSTNKQMKLLLVFVKLFEIIVDNYQRNSRRRRNILWFVSRNINKRIGHEPNRSQICSSPLNR